ncbi:MAG TPA: hypothetical protein QGF01_02385 [Candidatus Nitrosopelagicus sp.]|nr:hypothetical protein [Nitrosopumilales archaeon]MDP7284878.1 hypothetical protein [Candidatus Nitrosopelagicus sp.]HJN19779.1 hypothetical protein [Candidatus Nitrosopelagicus sp.]
MKIVLEDFSEYLKGVMRQILDSYNIIIQLDDEPSDLAIIKKELSKIRGQLTVLKNKLKSKEYQSDDLVTLYKVSLYYTETYDFSREINLLSQIYYNDPLRLKNLRLLIIESLNDKKLIEKFQEIFNRL